MSRADRIAQAREAAIMAVQRLRPSDIASVVIFGPACEMLWPRAAGYRSRQTFSAS